MSKTRSELTEELTSVLTAMVENSRERLTLEIGLVLENEDELIALETLKLINEECDKKLTMIPATIRGLLDEADNNATIISNDYLRERGIIG
jgi:hypothetical protein